MSFFWEKFRGVGKFKVTFFVEEYSAIYHSKRFKTFDEAANWINDQQVLEHSSSSTWKIQKLDVLSEDETMCYEGKGFCYLPLTDADGGC